MSILTVGAGQQFATLARAVTAALDGDTIEVRAGTYTNDFTTIAKDVTIEGVGGTAHFIATVTPPNAKAIMVTQSDLILRNLEFSGAAVADDNGAGIRYEGGHLFVENSYFHHNQNGLLANGDVDGTITVRNSEFAHNGAGDGQSHNLYVNRIHRLTVDDSYFHDVSIGHHVKSRATTTILTDNRLIDGPTGTSSYNIDLPNGGDVVIDGNVIHQNAKSPNNAIVNYGYNSVIANSSLQMTDNLIVNDHASPNARLLVNRTSVTADVSGTDVWGLTPDQMASGPADVSGSTYLTSRPALDTRSTWDEAIQTPAPTTPDTSTIYGAAGDDTLAGTSGSDSPLGFAGDDRLDGGAGADRLVGGAGNDRYYVGDAGDVVIEIGGEGTADTVYSSISSYSLPEFVNHLYLDGDQAFEGLGNRLDNRIFGNNNGNRLVGGDGDDRLYGRGGPDQIDGGDGDDFLQAGAGTDRLTGGPGEDRLDWNNADDAGLAAVRDLIVDFTQGQDRIDLSGLDAVQGESGNGTFTFIGANGFSGQAGQLRFRQFDSMGDTLIQGDTDGDRIADFEIRLDGDLLQLQASDFVL